MTEVGGIALTIVINGYCYLLVESNTYDVSSTRNVLLENFSSFKCFVLFQ